MPMTAIGSSCLFSGFSAYPGKEAAGYCAPSSEVGGVDPVGALSLSSDDDEDVVTLSKPGMVMRGAEVVTQSIRLVNPNVWMNFGATKQTNNVKSLD